MLQEWGEWKKENFKYIYIHLLFMATKCITITVEAYERLAAQKKDRESFSDVINRTITKKGSLLDLVGLLTPKEAEEMRRHVAGLKVETY